MIRLLSPKRVGRCTYLIAMVFLIGCEEIPTSPIAPRVEAPENVVSSDGRGGYHWKILPSDTPARKAIFYVPKPTTLTFIESIDRVRFEKNLILPPFVEKTSFRPEGMADDVYEWTRRYWEPEPESKTLLILKRSPEVGIGTVCLSNMGDKLLTVATKIVEWNVDSGNQIRAVLCPIKNPISVAYDPGNETAIIQSEEMIARVSLEDGKVLGQWKPEDGRIESFTRTRVGDSIGVVIGSKMQKTKDLVCLEDNLSQEKKYGGPKLASNRISFHPSGKWILGVTFDGMVRWHCGSPQQAIQTLENPRLDTATAIPLSGSFFDCWVDAENAYRFANASIPDPNRPTWPANTMMFLSDVQDASNGFRDEKGDWLVIRATKRDKQGNLREFIQEVDFEVLASSDPWMIPFKDYRKLSANSNFERLAFELENELRVVTRGRWIDSEGTYHVHLLSSLIFQKRFDQLEICAKAIQQCPLHRCGLTGNRYYRILAQQLAKRLSGMDTNPLWDNYREGIEEWRKTESELALSVLYLQRLHEADKNANQNSIPKVYATCRQVLSRFAEKYPKSEICLTERIGMELRLGAQLESVEGLLKTYLEEFPNETSAYFYVCRHLLPRWGGRPGDVVALMDSLSEIYPEPFGEILFGGLGVAVATEMNFSNVEAFSKETGIETMRLYVAAEKMVHNGRAPSLDLEQMLNLYLNEINQGGHNPRGSWIASELFQRCDTLSRFSYNRSSYIRELEKIRRDSRHRVGETPLSPSLR